MSAKIYLIRHGETLWSLTGQHTSRTDLPLTSRGEQQARDLGKRLNVVAFSHVLISPLQRARRTCELAGFGGEVCVVPNLQEWDYGDYEGYTPSAIHVQRPDWDVFRDGCPGGESAAHVSARVDEVLSELRGLEGRIAVFSHGHFLRALGARWINLSIRHGRYLALDPASLCILAYEHNDVAVPAISLWNEVSNEAVAPLPQSPSGEPDTTNRRVTPQEGCPADCRSDRVSSLYL